MTTCRLSEHIAPAYYDAHGAIRDGLERLVLTGGRGSGKSSFAAMEGLLRLVQDPEVHGVVLRKVAATLRRSVWAQYLWAMEMLGLEALFEPHVSRLELTYLPTGQRLLFLGVDDTSKLKSLKAPFGHFGYLHIEEADQFASGEELRSVEQTILRGEGKSLEILTYNPPRSRMHWINREGFGEREGQLWLHTTYLDMPRAWLGERFWRDAAHLERTRPELYEHEYLGVANGTGGAVFTNVVARRITKEEQAGLDRLWAGVDWGWWPDPWAFCLVGYLPHKRALYILKEAQGHRLTNRESAETVKRLAGPQQVVVCDSAEPKSVSDYRAYGIRAQKAEKGPGSRGYSIKWLQGLDEIVIDPENCPEALKEFMECRYRTDRLGQEEGVFAPGADHHIDAVRYATERIWRRRGR